MSDVPDFVYDTQTATEELKFLEFVLFQNKIYYCEIIFKF